MGRASTIAVIPQRNTSAGWVRCEAHRAQQWAVARMRKQQVNSIIARYSTKAVAEQVAKSERQRDLGPYRPCPKPGSKLLRRPMTTERLPWDEALTDDDAFLKGDLR